MEQSCMSHVSHLRTLQFVKKKKKLKTAIRQEVLPNETFLF